MTELVAIDRTARVPLPAKDLSDVLRRDGASFCEILPNGFCVSVEGIIAHLALRLKVRWRSQSGRGAATGVTIRGRMESPSEGFADLDLVLDITPTESERSALRLEGEVRVGGRLALVGSRDLSGLIHERLDRIEQSWISRTTAVVRESKARKKAERLAAQRAAERAAEEARRKAQQRGLWRRLTRTRGRRFLLVLVVLLIAAGLSQLVD